MWELIINFNDGRKMHRDKMGKLRCDAVYDFMVNNMITLNVKSVTKRVMEA